MLINKQASLVSGHVADVISDSMEDVRFCSFQNGDDSGDFHMSEENEVICVDNDDSIVLID